MISEKSKKYVNLDQLGIGVSILCAVHCVLLPVLLTVLPLAGLKFLNNEYIEVLIIGISVTLACLSLGRSYRVHRDKIPLIMVCIGFLSIALSHFIVSGNIEWIFLTLGGLVIAAAHWRNRQLSKCCNL